MPFLPVLLSRFSAHSQKGISPKLEFRWSLIQGRPFLFFLMVFVLLISGGLNACQVILLEENRAAAGTFQGERAYQGVVAQVGMGPRYVGTEGYREVQVWIREQLEESGWQVEAQITNWKGRPVHNIIATRGKNGSGAGEGSTDHILLGAHYDTRIYADQDPDPGQRADPVLGANDGASGVAVLLELARVMPDSVPVRLVFFDAEDNGKIPGWDWILGSEAYLEEIVRDEEQVPEVVVIVDMIGDRDLNIYQERSSTAWLRDSIWEAAAELGYQESFIPREKYSILDDHTPFLRAEIPAVDVIDFDYPYWHTTGDTVDKVSPESLEVVGETLLHWLTSSEVPLGVGK